MGMHGAIARTGWQVRRTEARGRRGAVATKHDLAASVGIEVLRAGGNSVDAAVAMAFTLAVVEPSMSGLGGGGFLVLFDAARGATSVVDCAMVAPRAAVPDLFRLTDGDQAVGLFGWPAVANDANSVGHRAVAVPGAVAGLLLAHERQGSLPLAQLLEPAIGFADQGVEVDWFTSLMIGVAMGELRRFPGSAAVFVPQGRPPRPFLGEPGERLVQRDLATTLRAIAAGGADGFYRGPFAEALHDEMARSDGLISRDDLAAYQPRVHEPGLRGQYRGHTVVGVPVPSGSPTVLEQLALLERYDVCALGHNSASSLHLMAETGLRAFDDRFAQLADERSGPAAAALLDPAYLDLVAAAIGPHGKAMRRVAPAALAQAPDAREQTTTTLAAADSAGNVVVLTMTLLSNFGSAVTVPGTGVILNNGMMWFDPRPGRPNSVGPGKRPLNNMSPLLVLRDGRPRLAVGAMGGRRILGAVATIVSNILDFGMGMQEACAAPRIDLSTGVVLADPRIPSSVLDALRARGHTVQESPDVFGAFAYGSPAAILVGDDGLLCTGVDPLSRRRALPSNRDPAMERHRFAYEPVTACRGAAAEHYQRREAR